jgi:hypothetical protein
MNSALSAADIVQVWEEGQSQHPIDRALTMLSLSHPGVARRKLAALSIGERDVRLLDVREKVFGRKLQLFAECPACSEALEFDVETRHLREIEPSGTGKDSGVAKIGSAGSLRRVWNDYTVEFRLPNSLDLALAIQAGSEPEAYRVLLRECVLKITREGVETAVERLFELPELLIGEIAAAMAAADPRAEIVLNLDCPACGSDFQELFDIVSFLWNEFASRAKDLVYEVHALARYYGWSERDILDMSAQRRKMYLGMIGF